ncbi:hypothetical protein COCCADRAFT_94145, partial [Bipolaris zeicola 26-R-13]
VLLDLVTTPTAALYVWPYSTLFVFLYRHRPGTHCRRLIFFAILPCLIMLICMPITELHVLWLLILAHRVPKSESKENTGNYIIAYCS